MSLLISLGIHRQALFKALKEVKVPKDVLKEVLTHIINSMFVVD